MTLMGWMANKRLVTTRKARRNFGYMCPLLMCSGSSGCVLPVMALFGLHNRGVSHLLPARNCFPVTSIKATSVKRKMRQVAAFARAPHRMVVLHNSCRTHRQWNDGINSVEAMCFGRASRHPRYFFRDSRIFSTKIIDMNTCPWCTTARYGTVS